MAVNSSPLGPRQIQNALRRGAKTALVTGGIQPATRRGNKELDLAVQRLAQQTYSSLEEAAKTGEALGQKIVELSQAKGKTDLDGGIVRQMMLTGEIPTVVKTAVKPAKTTPVVIEPAPKPAPTAKAEAIAPPVAPGDADATDDVDATADDVDAIADDVDAIADDVDAAAGEVEMAAEAIVDGAAIAEAAAAEDAAIDDAPELEALETLEPEAIAPPAPEPAIAADAKAAELTKAVSNSAEADDDLEAIADAAAAEPETIGAGK